MTGCEWNDNDIAAPTLHLGGADDSLLGIIAAFHDYVRTEMSHEIQGSILRKDHHDVNAFQRRKNIGALGVSTDRARRTFEATNRVVAVDADDQRIRSFAGRFQDVDVPRMQQIEDTVGESYSTFIPFSPPPGLIPRRDLGRWFSGLQSLLSAEGLKCSTRSFLNGSLITSSYSAEMVMTVGVR